MSKRSLTWMMVVSPLCGVACAGTSDAPPASSSATATTYAGSPVFEARANSSLLFESADRQSALDEQLQSAGARRYAAFAGMPRLRFGAVPDNLSLLDPLGPVLNERARRYLSSAEFEKKTGRAVGIVTIGLLRETGSALGSQQSTALALNTRPTTTFTSLSLGYALGARSALTAMASYGKTEGFGSPDSLMAQVSSVRTMAYSVGLSRRELFSSHDRVAVTLSVPTKVRSGALQGSAAAVGGYSSGLDYTRPVLNMRPTATERDLEFGYTTTFGKAGNQGKLTGAVMLRVNPGHDASAAPDWLTGVRYVHGF